MKVCILFKTPTQHRPHICLRKNALPIENLERIWRQEICEQIKTYLLSSLNPPHPYINDIIFNLLITNRLTNKNGAVSADTNRVAIADTNRVFLVIVDTNRVSLHYKKRMMCKISFCSHLLGSAWEYSEGPGAVHLMYVSHLATVHLDD